MEKGSQGNIGKKKKFTKTKFAKNPRKANIFVFRVKIEELKAEESRNRRSAPPSS